MIASNHSIILNETVFQPAITFNNTHDEAFLSVNITPVCAERAYEFIIGMNEIIYFYLVKINTV